MAAPQPRAPDLGSLLHKRADALPEEGTLGSCYHFVVCNSLIHLALDDDDDDGEDEDLPGVEADLRSVMEVIKRYCPNDYGRLSLDDLTRFDREIRLAFAAGNRSLASGAGSETASPQIRTPAAAAARFAFPFLPFPSFSYSLRSLADVVVV